MQDKKTTNFKDGQGRDRTLSAHPPNTCPLCHEKINPHYIGQDYSSAYDLLQIIWRCNNLECGKIFIQYFEVDEKHIIHKALRPNNPKSKDFSEGIRKLSGRFVDIYGEALAAEENDLLNVAGPGYRKAFEFLIKDYAKSITDSEEDREKIDNLFSGKVVEQYISDPRIKAMAKRSLWLGNDETHYLRIWLDKDMNDMKGLIDLTVHFIEMELLASKYETEMPTNK